jgi:hypothetical protein
VNLSVRHPEYIAATSIISTIDDGDKRCIRQVVAEHVAGIAIVPLFGHSRSAIQASSAGFLCVVATAVTRVALMLALQYRP